jgi:hypothetical protein
VPPGAPQTPSLSPTRSSSRRSTDQTLPTAPAGWPPDAAHKFRTTKKFRELRAGAPKWLGSTPKRTNSRKAAAQNRCRLYGGVLEVPKLRVTKRFRLVQPCNATHKYQQRQFSCRTQKVLPAQVTDDLSARVLLTRLVWWPPDVNGNQEVHQVASTNPMTAGLDSPQQIVKPDRRPLNAALESHHSADRVRFRNNIITVYPRVTGRPTLVQPTKLVWWPPGGSGAAYDFRQTVHRVSNSNNVGMARPEITDYLPLESNAILVWP